MIKFNYRRKRVTEDIMFDFEYHIKNLPDKPGVYIMKNDLGLCFFIKLHSSIRASISESVTIYSNSAMFLTITLTFSEWLFLAVK